MRFMLVSIGLGVLFAALDALINANPRARRLYAFYAPVAKTTINAPAGIVIDLVYGFVIVGIFLQISPALPGATGLAKGAVFGLGMWFFRVAMAVATTWMTHRVPAALLAYQLATGLAEMIALGLLAGALLTPV